MTPAEAQKVADELKDRHGDCVRCKADTTTWVIFWPDRPWEQYSFKDLPRFPWVAYPACYTCLSIEVLSVPNEDIIFEEELDVYLRSR